MSSEFKTGDLAVVSTAKVTCVYTIKTITSSMAALQYLSGGKMASAGVVPRCCLIKPDEDQLKNGSHYYKLEKTNENN